MESLAESLKTTWSNHCSTMRILIECLDEAALAASSSARGGRDVRAQLMHIHEIRLAYMGSFLKNVQNPPAPFEKGSKPDQTMLLQAFTASEACLADYMDHCLAKGGKVAGFKGGLIQMLGYFIAHEAQHRGNILLTIKLQGQKIPEPLKWSIWDWNKL